MHCSISRATQAGLGSSDYVFTQTVDRQAIDHSACFGAPPSPPANTWMLTKQNATGVEVSLLLLHVAVSWLEPTLAWVSADDRVELMPCHN